MAPSAVLLHLLVALLSSGLGSLPPPRTSFLLGSADRPLVTFSLPDVHYPTTLLLSDDASTLYVGAQDAVLSLDVSQSDAIGLKKKVEWEPPEQEIYNCEIKGKDPKVDCPNFVHVLQPINSSHLYACGSFAYSPQDAFIDTESFSLVQRGRANGRCPFNPFERNTATTIDGELFTATTTDFRGVKPQISRHFSKHGRPDVSQDSSVSLLEEPVFVSSSLDPAEGKLYFFFNEVGKEFTYLSELRIARVAQVCKDDVGGQRTLQKKWTSFAKASLLCQSQKQLPFTILQDVFTLQPAEGGDVSAPLFYGVFTSQWSSDPESAVCVFTLQEIRRVFSGSYRTFDTTNHQWSQQGAQSYLGKCGLDNATDSELAEVKKSFLTSNSIQPAGNSPVVVSSEHQYSRVVAMTTKAANNKQYTVLFLLSEAGVLHKVVLFDGGAHIIEEIQVFTQTELVKSMILSPSKGVLYVGTSWGVTAVPVVRCSIYRTCSQCVLARDPFCGWSLTRRVCTSVDGSSDAFAQDVENGKVQEMCQQQTRIRLDTVTVPLNEAVRLQCVKPSNLATLTWTTPQLNTNQDKLFIQSADGSLSFLATDAMFGTYLCKAEEGGHSEVVVSYEVRQIVSPRSVKPQPTVSKHEISDDGDEPNEDIKSVEPAESLSPSPSADTNVGEKVENILEDDTLNKNETVINKQQSGLLTSFKDITTSDHAGVELVQEKSYYTELVVVSLLLVLSILILSGLHVWRQTNTGLQLKKGNKSMESIPSLSVPEDACPEVKVK